jgi:hypothetical protein
LKEPNNRFRNKTLMANTVDKQYSLRNDSKEVFTIKAEVTEEYETGAQGATITAKISHQTIKPFTFVVEFGGDFVKTKSNFTPEMYLHTAISIVESQIESKKYVDTRLKVSKDSGLTETSPL